MLHINHSDFWGKGFVCYVSCNLEPEALKEWIKHISAQEGIEMCKALAVLEVVQRENYKKRRRYLFGRFRRRFIVKAVYDLSGTGSFVVKKNFSVSGQCVQQDHTDDAAGNHFANPYRKHHERDGKIDSVSIIQNKRYDYRICHNRRHRSQETAASAQLVGKYSSNQGCDTSEDDIHWNGTAKNIGNDTSHK